MFDADVLLWNATGAKSFTGATVDNVGLGGSELEVTQVAEGLAARGHSVIVSTGDHDECKVRGVRYVPHSWIHDSRPRRRFRAMYVERWSPVPDAFAERYVVRATDVASPPYDVHARGLGQGWSALAVNTQWHARGFPFAKEVLIIPPILGGLDTPEDLRLYGAGWDGKSLLARGFEKDPRLFVYASAPSKGLQPTLAMWRKLKREHHDAMAKMRLRIVLPGRSFTDAPEVHDAAEYAIEMVGVPTTLEYRREIARAAGLFYVNTFQETFCNAAALAEKFGGRAHVLATVGRCGMREALAEGGRYLTTDAATFEREFLDSLTSPPPMSVVVDRSADAVIPMWELALHLAE